MDKMMEHILEIVAAALVVIFLLFFLLNGNFGGEKGIFAGLINNPYQEIENDIGNNELVDAYNDQILTGEDSYSIRYIGSVLDVYNPVTEQPVYDIRELYAIEYGGVEYRRNGIFWSGDDGNLREFRFYLADVRNKKGNSVISLKSLDDASESETLVDEVIYDEETYQFAVMQEGRYTTVIRVTDKNTLRTLEREITIPARLP